MSGFLLNEAEEENPGSGEEKEEEEEPARASDLSSLMTINPRTTMTVSHTSG